MTISKITVTLILAIGLVSFAPRFVGGPSTSLRAGPQAQSAAATAVAIDADDIGGVVIGAEWTRGRRLGDRRDARPPRPLHQDRRHRRSGTLRRSRSAEGAATRLGARLRPGRQREVHERARASSSTSRPRPRRRRPTRRSTTPRSTGIRCSRSRRRPSLADRANFAANITQQRWLGSMKNNRLHRLPPARTALDAHDARRARHVRLVGADAWRRRVQSGQAGQHDARSVERARRRVVPVLRRLDRSHRERRAAARQARAPPGRRAQHRRHAARLDGRQALPARSDLERSAQPDGERPRPALRIARVQLRPDADSRSRRRTRRRRSGCRCGMRTCRSASGPATRRR